jgi:SAM-dependent methyltransferase
VRITADGRDRGGCNRRWRMSIVSTDRARGLIEAVHQPAELPLRDGYLDVLADVDPMGSHPGQRWMASRTLPLIYERLWRPLGGRLLMGATGPGMRGEHKLALEMLALAGGNRVLDVGCGPGNFTRTFAGEVGDGLVIGLDASRTMLARAVQQTDAHNVAYVRADASALPFREASFDAVCCFAALYLIEQPMRAVSEIARVLAPGGRVALLASCNRGPLPGSITGPFVKRLTGVRMFARDELTAALRDHGLSGIEQQVAGLAQFVAAGPTHRGRSRRAYQSAERAAAIAACPKEIAASLVGSRAGTSTRTPSSHSPSCTPRSNSRF